MRLCASSPGILRDQEMHLGIVELLSIALMRNVSRNHPKYFGTRKTLAPGPGKAPGDSGTVEW